MTRFRPATSRNSSASSGTKVVGSDTVSGLIILHGDVNEAGEDARADIITIHGLTGHFLKTWTTVDGVCWPRDLLPKMTPRIGPTRIMTFGYAAGRHGTKLDLDIEDAAWKLVHEIERVRSTKELQNRPLIFIVHSLGGLVLKKALIISNNMLSLRHILWATEGIIFLATPHRGSAMADVADRILRFTNVSGAPQKFVKALKLGSSELWAIAEDFRQIVNQRKMPISSFYELQAFKAIPCLNAVVRRIQKPLSLNLRGNVL
jgi:hypothetical protein